MKFSLLWIVIAAWPGLAFGADLNPPELAPLPKLRSNPGRPLMDVLQERQSTRSFSTKPIAREILADLLWAAFGVNRPETGQRTAPSTMNLRSIDIYVMTADGCSRYDAESHGLVRVGKEDARALSGGQDSIRTAPVALVYVADHAKFGRLPEQERSFYAAADAGFIGQNVYLYCASAGLGCVVHMPGDRAGMGRALGLRPEQQIVLVHSIGYASDSDRAGIDNR